jgi:zinc protease
MQNNSQSNPHVFKRVLSNGMTILVRPVHTIPKVSLQIWYDVGAKDEKTGEKGLAHLIEHMIFKGTESLLSESDINVLTHKLSGSCNAFTWYDYTGYLFEMPSNNWEKVLPVVADCMVNCAFKDEHLNSEMKAVIQELKMRRDNYTASLVEELLTCIFPDHPYHYPVIGYKQDLWSVRGSDLRAFYKKHYIPNNATLVVVGDVDPERVFELAQGYFGSIPANPEYKREQFYFNDDIAAKQLVVYRDIQQPYLVYVFIVPGFYKKLDHVQDLLTWILGLGKASRLHQKLVDELQLATEVSAFSWNLFEHGLFIIGVEPIDIKQSEQIEQIINQEIADVARGKLKDEEVQRAIKKAQMQYYKLLESMEQQTYKIGEGFLATGDENYAFEYLKESPEILKQQIQNVAKAYLRPAVMHKGILLPLPEEEKEQWALLQQLSDQEDERILSVRERTTPVEPARYADTVESAPPKKFHFPCATKMMLPNGMKVLYYDNKTTPKINLLLEFKASSYYDSEQKPGLYNFVTHMMQEGTSNYTASQLAYELESRGMSLNVYPGGCSISMLTQDFERGLELLCDVLTDSVFNEKNIEKVRTQILADLKNFWDEPYYFTGQLVKEVIYKGSPHSKNILGTEQSIRAITKDDLLQFYKMYITPQGAKLAVVGDLNNYDIQRILENRLGKWQGKSVADLVLTPPQEQTAAVIIDYPINRDQVVLCFAGLSIKRTDPDYDKLLLFDQILGGGELGSLSSRLFQLREQTGLFYTINGSLISNADEERGMVLVRTIVSLDRLKEAEKVIKETLATVVDSITEHEVELAKSAIINSSINYFESNFNMARVFLFIDKYNMPADYFDSRIQTIEKITVDDIKQAAKKVLNVDKLLTVRVGRVGSLKQNNAN